MKMHNVVIVGAGAMGCFFAARLSEAGAAITLVDVDKARLNKLHSNGITLVGDDGERVVRVRALEAREAGAADVVMLCTKGMHSATAIRSVSHLADSHAHVLTLQNGIGNAEVIAEVFAPGRILIGVTDFPADLKDATHVSSHGKGHIRLGGFTPDAQDAADAISQLFNRAGLDTEVDNNVEVAIWEKVAFNAALNALATITGSTVGEMDVTPGHRITQAVIDEVVATAAAKGIQIDRGSIQGKVAFALANHRDHKASMLQDRLAGRPTEIEQINGAIVRAAEQVGVKVPVTATLADLVRLVDMRARNN